MSELLVVLLIMAFLFAFAVALHEAYELDLVW